MKRANTLWLVAVLALVGAGVAWQARQRAGDIRSMAAAAETAQTGLRMQIRRQEAAIAAAVELRVTLERERTQLTAAASEKARKISSNVAAQAAELKKFRAGLSSENRKLYEALGLEPAEIAKFENFITQRAARLSDVATVAIEEGYSVFDPPIVAARSDAENWFRKAVNEMLGEAVYRQWLESIRSTRVRVALKTFAGHLIVTPWPLSVQQTQQLEEVLKRPASWDERLLTQVRWTAVFPVARVFLSPEQIMGYESATRGNDTSDQLEWLIGEAKRSGAIVLKRPGE